MCAPLLIKDTQVEAFVPSAVFIKDQSVLKCGEKPETLETALLTQPDAKQGQITLSCKNVWLYLSWHIKCKIFCEKDLIARQISANLAYIIFDP